MTFSCLVSLLPQFSAIGPKDISSENCNLYQEMALVFLKDEFCPFNLLEKDKKHYCKKKSDVYLENKSGNQIINNT